MAGYLSSIGRRTELTMITFVNISFTTCAILTLLHSKYTNAWLVICRALVVACVCELVIDYYFALTKAETQWAVETRNSHLSEPSAQSARRKTVNVHTYNAQNCRRKRYVFSITFTLSKLTVLPHATNTIKKQKVQEG